MATMEQTSNTPVIQISEKKKGESLWGESWKRLRRNRAAVIGGIIILLNIIAAIFAPVLAPQKFDRTNLPDNNATPAWVTQIFPNMKPKDQGGYVTISEKYPIGADNLGRDMLSRIIYGTQVSLLVAFIGPLVSIIVGLTVGMIAGYFGGATDNVLMRLVDLMYAFPTLLLIILMMTFFRTSFASPEPGTISYTLGQLDKETGGMILIFIGIGLTSWMQMARLVRGQVLSIRETEYVQAARALGATTPKIMISHILPNILGPLIVAETLTIPTYISYEAFLSFIGLGVNPPTPSWGSMISEGSKNISSYPNQAIFPAIALFLIMFAFNFLGDGLRDALDPRMRGRD
ncbi:MAG: ABC transporter permease [Chloroflexi bacterium]|nr:ABC transporter permease [Chloroflexota bacterium]MCC6891570.1 ABC transporter permease [Anaerolineae bacterium]